MRQQFAWARLVLVGLFCSMSLVAQQRTFVSTTGVDTNPCLLQSPCRSFDAAVAAVASGGEVIALDSGGYGPFTIDEPVSIVAPAGIYAGVSAFSGTAVHVDVAGAQPVAIKGLTLVGLGGAIGIDIAESQSVVIERVDVSGFSAHGVSARSGNHSIERSTFRNNGEDSLLFAPSAGSANATIGNSEITMHSAGGGITVEARARVVVHNSVLSHSSYGITVSNAIPGESAVAVIADCVILNNAYGISAANTQPTGEARAFVSGSTVSLNAYGVSSLNSTARVLVSDSVIVRNATGLQSTLGGAILSREDNTLAENGSDGAFTGTFAAQ